MADIEEFVVVETPPEMKRRDEPSPETSPEPNEPTPTTTTEPEPPQANENEEKQVEEPKPKEDEDKKESTPVEENKPEEEPVTQEETTPPTAAVVDSDKKEQSTENDDRTEEPKADTDIKEDEKKESEEPPKEEVSTAAAEPQVQADETAKNEEDKEAPKQDEEEIKPAEEQQQPTKPQRAPIAISGKQIKQLLTGTEMLKAKKGTKVFPRLYYITGDLIRLMWNSKRKSIAKSQIPLSQITDVIPGRTTTTFKLYRGTQDEELCFSIIYQEGGVQKILDLVAASPEEATLWTNGLLALTGRGVTENTVELRKKWLRTLFDEADANSDGTLDLKEVIKMLKRLNIGISQRNLKRKFKEADRSGNGDNKLDFDEFCTLFAEFSEHPELRVLFNLYASSDDGSYMTAGDLLNFLESEQGNDEATIEYCQSIIERFEPSEAGQRYLFSLDGFAQYILSDDNDIFKREHSQIYQDMTHPLAHYFIASSHNTYLLEDQLSGPSSVDAYIGALKKGCRCVELDCWDGDNNEPIIYHGHTLTSKILFKDCIEAIKEHAFTASPYPLILSIENHCSVAQQHVMADYLESILGDMLHKEERNEELGQLPSPEDLKYKILIKAKKLAKEHEDKDLDDGEVSDEDEGAEVDKEEVEKVKPKPVTSDNPDDIPDGNEQQQQAAATTEVRKVIRDRSGSTLKKKEREDVQKPAAKRKLSSKLSKCVNYVQSVHFKGFEESVNAPFYHMSSFGESSAFKHSEGRAASYMEYNKKHLSRTYPAGMRVDSSNYEPIDLWNCGCQIVALNYQTPGRPMDYNIGKFQQNGGCGYILKPVLMREDYTHFNHKERDNTHGVVSPKLVTIRIISGQRLPKPEGGDKDGEIIDPYVVVKLTGLTADKTEFRTNYTNDNGFNPVWNETFNVVVNFPELCIVRFCVMDYDRLSQDDFIGQYTLPLTSMNSGYRNIKLRNTNWEVIEGATILVEVKVQEWVGPQPKTKDKLRLLQTKKARQYPLMKPVTFPAVDAVFRNAKSAVHTSVDIREDFHFYLMLFKEACGKSSISDCIEALSSKAHLARIQLKLVSTEVAGTCIYQIEVAGDSSTTGGVSGVLPGIMNAFNKLNGVISCVLNLSNKTADELDGYCKEALSQKDEFFNFLAQPTQQKKASQLRAIYSSNVATMKNESTELRSTLAVVNKLLEKIPIVAGTFGIPVTATVSEQQKKEEEPTTLTGQQSTDKEEDKPTEKEDKPAAEDTATPSTNELKEDKQETQVNEEQKKEEEEPTSGEDPPADPKEE